ncbi:MAG: hypothetical protein KKG04_08990 [Candidatus Thermoplasmatota archaeon]|nr:hypothetical protein [Candidatus Thermoplasmatota archaeon]
MKKTAIIEFILVLMLSLNGIGALGFYLSITYYDMVLHASAPIGAAVVLYLMVNSVLDKKGKYTFLRGQGLVLAMTTVGIFLWEGWEYYGDLIFGTMMRGQPGEPLDTTYDILAGICSLTVIYIINTYIHKRYFKNKIRV